MDIFVFGSNLAGIHGAGAAKFAFKNHGAKWGQGIGLQGYSYAIPTKDRNLKTLDLETIKFYIDDFITGAAFYPVFNFMVTEIGCGLAGYEPKEIAPLFKNAMEVSNIKLPARFLDVIEGTDLEGLSMTNILNEKLRDKQSFGYEY